MTQSKPLAQGMSIKGRDQYSKEDALIYGTLKLFESYGYDVIEPPTIEYYDVMHASGASAQQNMIKFIDPFGDIMVLQADPTISLAHYMSKQAIGLRKFAMVSSIHRAYTITSKRHEHFKQIGIEVFHDGGHYDEEVIELAIKSLKQAKVEDFILEIGHVGFIPTLLSSLEIPVSEFDKVSEIIMAKDGPAMDEFTLNYPTFTRSILMDVMSWFGPLKNVLLRVSRYELSQACLDIIRSCETYVTFASTQMDSQQIILDLSTLKPQSYYRGLTLTAYSNQSASPLLSGGRYEYLISDTSTAMSAIGFGMDVSRLAYVSSLTPPSLKNIAIRAMVHQKQQALLRANELRTSTTRVHVLVGDNVDVSTMDEIIDLTQEEQE